MTSSHIQVLEFLLSHTTWYLLWHHVLLQRNRHQNREHKVLLSTDRCQLPANCYQPACSGTIAHCPTRQTHVAARVFLLATFKNIKQVFLLPCCMNILLGISRIPAEVQIPNFLYCPPVAVLPHQRPLCYPGPFLGCLQTS